MVEVYLVGLLGYEYRKFVSSILAIFRQWSAKTAL